MNQLRRWYIEDGKFGKPLADLELYEWARRLKVYPGLVEQYDVEILALAVEFETTPDEIEQWDWYHIKRLSLVRQARAEANEELMMRNAKQSKGKR